MFEHYSSNRGDCGLDGIGDWQIIAGCISLLHGIIQPPMNSVVWAASALYHCRGGFACLTFLCDGCNLF